VTSELGVGSLASYRDQWSKCISGGTTFSHGCSGSHPNTNHRALLQPSAYILHTILGVHMKITTTHSLHTLYRALIIDSDKVWSQLTAIQICSPSFHTHVAYHLFPLNSLHLPMTPEALVVPHTRMQKLRTRIVEVWLIAHRQAWRDLKSRWQIGALWVLCLLVFTGLVYGLVLLALIGHPGVNLALSVTPCQPDGKFYTNPDDFNYWHSSDLFQITLGFGKLTFTSAKVIDVVWDVVSRY
jgi:hypothetical protein